MKNIIIPIILSVFAFNTALATSECYKFKAGYKPVAGNEHCDKADFDGNPFTGICPTPFYLLIEIKTSAQCTLDPIPEHVLEYGSGGSVRYSFGKSSYFSPFLPPNPLTASYTAEMSACNEHENHPANEDPIVGYYEGDTVYDGMDGNPLVVVHYNDAGQSDWLELWREVSLTAFLDEERLKFTIEEHYINNPNINISGTYLPETRSNYGNWSPQDTGYFEAVYVGATCPDEGDDI